MVAGEVQNPLEVNNGEQNMIKIEKLTLWNLNNVQKARFEKLIEVTDIKVKRR